MTLGLLEILSETGGVTLCINTYGVPFPIQRLGTPYGGWIFCETNTLAGANIISAGAGEDISFDILMAQRYQTNTIIVDPTPRAVQHVKEVLARAGLKNEFDLNNASGKQNPEAYNMRNINPNNLSLLETALYKKGVEHVEFYFPSKPDHVSCSINDYKNGYRRDGDHIQVRSSSYIDILEQYQLESVEILKLDVEGAEHEVIKDVIRSGVLPTQILVEFDDVSAGNSSGLESLIASNELLIASGYRPFATDGTNSNISYLLS